MSTREKINSLEDHECIVKVLRKEVAANACKSCGKCVFGYEGITQLEMILSDLTEKKGTTGDLALMQELCGLMVTQSLCEEGEAIALATLEALKQYPDDFEEHATKKGCRSGVCRKFMTYHILADKCIGCGDCLDECEEEAILGKNKFVHVIMQDECVQCGACLEACEEGAVVRAGTMKPRCPKKPIPCKP